ncbi:MAG TPA: prepilin-type N-terminal cleavage/methylation domain-containing protein [Syntrophorhabdaceae bacterium]|nr:prepilin-type N-terminal cleavage/methylation domain-containing protein [Syntrophorhabdaceae bacterium]
MRRKGFTLVELIIVITILAILCAIGLVSFRDLSRKYRVENQIRRTYSDLMNARTRAMHTNMTHFVNFGLNQYAIYQDTNLNKTLDIPPAGDTQVLMRQGPDVEPYSVLNNNPGNENIIWSGGAVPVQIDGRGLVSAGSTGTICIAAQNVQVVHNCITVTRTRIAIGQWTGQAAGVCDANHCAQ